MSKYRISISVMDEVSYTIDSASCSDHAAELAAQHFKQDHPDFNFMVVGCEVINDEH